MVRHWFNQLEGCFNIVITRTKFGLGWRVQARFIIELHIKDVDLLHQLQAFFGGQGTLTTTGLRESLAL